MGILIISHCKTLHKKAGKTFWLRLREPKTEKPTAFH